MANQLLPDDATFERSLGNWSTTHAVRVTSPTPHAGTGVMKVTFPGSRRWTTWTSEDGVTITRRANPTFDTTGGSYSVAWMPSLNAVLAAGTPAATFAKSDDGEIWQPTVFTPNPYIGVAFGAGVGSPAALVSYLGGGATHIASTDDGTNFTDLAFTGFDPTFGLKATALYRSSAGRWFLGIGNYIQAIWTSDDDGLTWTNRTCSMDVAAGFLEMEGGRIVAVGGPQFSGGAAGCAVYSDDGGDTWNDATGVTAPTDTIGLGDLVDAAGIGLVAIGSDGASGLSFTSDDGAVWTNRGSAPIQSGVGTSLVYAPSLGLLCGIGFDGGGLWTATSPDAVTWTTHPQTDPSSAISALCWTGDRFVLVGQRNPVSGSDVYEAIVTDAGEPYSAMPGQTVTASVWVRYDPDDGDLSQNSFVRLSIIDSAGDTLVEDFTNDGDGVDLAGDEWTLVSVTVVVPPSLKLPLDMEFQVSFLSAMISGGVFFVSDAFYDGSAPKSATAAVRKGTIERVSHFH